MAAGYRSYEAFWIGGLSVPIIAPPPTPVGPPSIVISGGEVLVRPPTHYGRTTSLDREFRSERDRLEELIEKEENEILSVIIAISQC